MTASEFRHHYAIAAVNGWNRVATGFHTGVRAPHHKASNGVARLRIGGFVTAHQPEISVTASADPGRRREHDNPRDECGHAGIQQDFVENSNHSTLSHTRLPLRAAALGHSPAHWTAKCYEFDNKEVRNGTKKRIVPRCRQPS